MIMGVSTDTRKQKTKFIDDDDYMRFVDEFVAFWWDKIVNIFVYLNLYNIKTKQKSNKNEFKNYNNR